MDRHRSPAPSTKNSTRLASASKAEGTRPQTSDLLTTDEAGTFLRLSRPTLERRRLAGEVPAFVRLGRRIYYRRADLEAWLAESRCSQAQRVGPP